MLESLLSFLFDNSDVLMAIPIAPIAIGAGLTAAGLFSGGGKTPSIDVSPFRRRVEQAGQQQRQLIRGQAPKLKAGREQFGTDIGSILAQFQQQGGAQREQFLQDIGDVTGERAQALSAQLRQRTLESTPELQRRILEAQAATGGIQRGSTQAALTQLAVGQGAQIARGETEIAQQEQVARQAAIERVFAADERELQTVLGINAQTLQALFQSGREDLIREAAQLLDENQRRTSNQLAIDQISANQQFAQTAVGNAQRERFSAALTQIGTTLLGAGFSSGGTPTAPSTTQGGTTGGSLPLGRDVTSVSQVGPSFPGTNIQLKF